uniref:SHSP domain-containing protein n=1 Tax=Oncorhynchus mykiss TaxID=8022 RepID=A0A8K9V3B2_ONCMY
MPDKHFFRFQQCYRNIKSTHDQFHNSSLELMANLQQQIFEDLDNVPPSLTIQPVSYKHDKDGEGFALTLDTKDFSQEELSVKQVGRKLKVSGKTEKKLDDGEGSYSYRFTCSLAHDGKLHIQAPKNPLSYEDEVAERVVPINCSLDVKTPQFLSKTEGSITDTQKKQENTISQED